MDQVVLVQEDTEDQVPAVAALAVAVPDEAVPDVVVPDEAVPADTEVVAFLEDNPVEVPVEEWPVEEDPAEVESLAAEQVQAEMIPEVHQEEQAPVPSMQEVRMMEEKPELIAPEWNMLNSRSEREQQDVEEKVERQRKLNHCHTELFPCLHLPSSRFACQEKLKWQQKWPPAKLGQSMMHQVQEKMTWRGRIDRGRSLRLFR